MSEELTSEQVKLLSSELAKSDLVESFDIIVKEGFNYLVLWTKQPNNNTVEYGGQENVPTAVADALELLLAIDAKIDVNVARYKICITKNADSFMEMRDKINNGEEI